MCIAAAAAWHQTHEQPHPRGEGIGVEEYPSSLSEALRSSCECGQERHLPFAGLVS